MKISISTLTEVLGGAFSLKLKFLYPTRITSLRNIFFFFSLPCRHRRLTASFKHKDKFYSLEVEVFLNIQ